MSCKRRSILEHLLDNHKSVGGKVDAPLVLALLQNDLVERLPRDLDEVRGVAPSVASVLVGETNISEML